MIGRHLGRYELLGKLGGGGMGEVFLAQRGGARGVGKPVVVKVVHRRHARSEELRAMFLDEARLAAAIRHPNVAAVEDLGEEGDELYMVIEHVPGASFAQVLTKLTTMGRRLLPAMSVAIVADAAAGLHAAHEARDEHGRALNIVHRDVSPQNVLLGTQGQVKVIDFGVAKASQRLQKTTGKELKGKLRYMAPEQLDGNVDRRTDVFALGVVLWEALTGRRLFDDPDDATVIRRILAGDVPRPSDFAEVPVALEACVMRALSRRTDDRFPSAEAFAEALHAALPTHEADAFARAAVLLGLLGPEIDDRSQRVGLPLVSALDTQELATAPLQAVQRWTEPLKVPAKRSTRGSLPDTAPRVSLATPEHPERVPAPPTGGRWIVALALALGGFAAGLGVVIVLIPQGGEDDAVSAPSVVMPSVVAPSAVSPSPVVPGEAVPSGSTPSEQPPTGASEPTAVVDAGLGSTGGAATQPTRTTPPGTSSMVAPASDSTSPARGTKRGSTRFPLANVDDPFADDL
ncbi:MAG: protein kinase [Myxococcota bacterium]|jgi:serine/threonine-protein kinase|nr:protein kinase [Myxococcota bacterium]